ncbi:hypothetical protein [Desulfonatronum thioautotrophicum]|uniref:hypothetical protein n=1 Tax=Desulfonatronum thioautotrophicum TaxID=617001 RepID=UPI0005EB8845|nr:hypothetical protein [Desulfonatronum thioautotrophicum]
MKTRILIVALLIGLAGAQVGCNRFVGGAAVGAVGAGAAYELQNKRQMDRLEQDLREGRITQEEYEARKEQISRGSLIY